jgi:hypothetical protein
VSKILDRDVLPGSCGSKTVEHVKTYKAPKQSTIDWVALSIISERNHGRMNLENEMMD